MCSLSQANIDGIILILGLLVVFGGIPFCWVATNVFYEYYKKKVGFY
jgi:hypothetical protein